MIRSHRMRAAVAVLALGVAGVVGVPSLFPGSTAGIWRRGTGRGGARGCHAQDGGAQRGARAVAGVF